MTNILFTSDPAYTKLLYLNFFLLKIIIDILMRSSNNKPFSHPKDLAGLKSAYLTIRIYLHLTLQIFKKMLNDKMERFTMQNYDRNLFMTSR